MAMMTVEAMEMAARSRSLRWPEKDWVMTVIENMASLLKMEGPAIAHNFFDSNHVCLSKLLALILLLGFVLRLMLTEVVVVLLSHPC